MIKYLIVMLLLVASVSAQTYKLEYVNGIKTETIGYEHKQYVGQPFADTIIHLDCELLDSMVAETYNLTWTSTGDDSTVGFPATFKITAYSNEAPYLLTFTIDNTDSAGYGDTVKTQVTLGVADRPSFQVQAIDDAGNESPLSNVAVGQMLYRQIRYEIDTSYVILKTYPEYTTLPIDIYIVNGLGFEVHNDSLNSVVTLHISPMRKKDISMNGYVDLTDLAMLIHYLTVPQRTR